ncbi:potassium channel family protein [Aliibacillus thermotolerans]|uniref:Potassium channel family protein n=1 Tax=Aliibacillus thermotolerans TaxID=1834418 RepID=A0ABW0U5C4_9BACI|nr:TrkA family potassium uptake protein [Aliibacillus thermotolerans]MDA3129063.1 potassium transporter Trk [Aliibacillus thermotolerans]
MRSKKQFAVIGLGRFGGSICHALMKEKMEVLAIDQDKEKVEEFASIVTKAVVADSTDEKALKKIGIQNFDHVIVAIGDNILASILTTIILDDLGVEKITVKAQNHYHEKVLNRIGADSVVHPERDIGVRVAHQVVSESVLEYLEVSDKYSIVEMVAGAKMVGKTIVELDFRATYGCNILAVKREEDVYVSPSPDLVMKEKDILIIIGADDDIGRLENHWMD